jgi:hypothetical protein
VADSSTVPLWVALVGPAATLLATAITLFYNSVNNRWNLRYSEAKDMRDKAHEEEMKRLELVRELAKERRQVYGTLLNLTKDVDIKNPEAIDTVLAALAEVELLADSLELRSAAADLASTWIGAWRVARRAFEEGESDPFATQSYKNVQNLLPALRDKLLTLGRQEILMKEEHPFEPPSQSYTVPVY